MVAAKSILSMTDDYPLEDFDAVAIFCLVINFQRHHSHIITFAAVVCYISLCGAAISLN